MIVGLDRVVLKVSPPGAGEPHAAAVLEAFDGRGMVRIYAHDANAILIERAVPGHSLLDVVMHAGDDEATAILAHAIGRMGPADVPPGVPTVAEWGRAFDAYRASGDRQVPAALVEEASDIYRRLTATQGRERLLHGDLHHGNLVFDAARGWLAIDPKGVVGELEYELGAALRNPKNHPELFTARDTIVRRVRHLSRALRLDESRVLGWAFAQAVLAAIWMIEDDGRLEPDCAWLVLADVLRPML